MSTSTLEKSDLFLDLDASHRCDSCSSRGVGQVIVSTDLPPLIFCGHHFRKNYSAFAESDYMTDFPEDFDIDFTKPYSNKARDAGSV